ncbi:DoxX family protein [Halocatena marina]|uniref:DoxX family protein n=1 Tax=Halocatena marina TaxID=2934937 RepID=UPI00360C4D3D
MEFTIFTAYVAATVLTAVANAGIATLDFIHHKQVLENMAQVDVPESWLPVLGTLKAAGAVGLLVGIIVPPIGTAAAVGLTIFYIGAIITHLRAREYTIAPATAYLLLAVVTLAPGMAS